MSYREEDKIRLKRQVTKQAVALAMEGRWQDAIAANKTLLESFPDDIDSYNRLGRAYMELGEYVQARGAYDKAMKLDPYNSIAQKNLSRLSLLNSPSGASGVHVQKVDPQSFIKEIGKAGVVSLVSLARPEVLAKLVAGAALTLKVEGMNLAVLNSLGEYVGQVDPRHGQRLAKFMENGNKYSAAVVNAAAEGNVTVMIRETYQDPSQAGRLSFPQKEGEPSHWTPAGDRMIRRELEYEENLPGDASYTIVGGEEGEETEVFLEEHSDNDDENEEE
jgi:tetratricopeptide (TPR) repeat protein